ncbi:hypothetical protein DICPUDRAFT_155807 [Dictyostelium purpureum]|uniref:Glycylpeptide N-tetradecanoyltransferase n=1 Tax=Dictyostelium purpureum TaxID=5786 RepID=F0ZUY0_DICPU|nr:uncharacterized protein DICPUDRAFT_155807 [Dictyostelium purpureum]EGC32258.1 hypothetical protein DICPUDRAFT_155807 [Dictyostelium purpureum]|eukprot:XP_003291225.1 hypothetical protein DICPUDRAFT_155807 [Dictyostelium purpureum]
MSDDKKQLEQSKKILELFKNASKQAPKEEKKRDSHDFWDTQPVPKISDNVVESGPIENKTLDDVRKEPLALPDAFEWVEVDVNNSEELKDLYTLLNENYVEDDDNMFRFDYSTHFLRWALQPPGFLKEWHIGVRVKASKKLVGFISGIPATISVDSKPIEMVEINFLCVHKRLREKRLAPVLIKEVTRRVNLRNIWQAAYTAGIVIPKPVSICRYYHRSLNPKKLVEINFSHIPPKMTMASMIKMYRVDDKMKYDFRPLEESDVPSFRELLVNYLSNYKVAPIFSSDEDVWHWFKPIQDVVSCYVKVDPESKKVTDVFSFYNLPSSVIGNEKYKTLKAAFSFYNVATTISITELVSDALIAAKKDNYDVYNCLDIFENKNFFNDLKFAMGDGDLQYYLYNYSTPTKKPSEIGLVLL